jgi:hypothetical protein
VSSLAISLAWCACCTSAALSLAEEPCSEGVGLLRAHCHSGNHLYGALGVFMVTSGAFMNQVFAQLLYEVECVPIGISLAPDWGSRSSNR